MKKVLLWFGLLVALSCEVREVEEDELGTCEATSGTSECSDSTVVEGVRWEKYLRLVSQALKEHRDCVNGVGVASGCGCYQSALEADLEVWQKKGSITRTDFETAKSRATHTVHYQVINHTLFRQQHCTFPARCEGVEHFLLQLLHDLPDVELLVNVHDFPMASKHGDPLPVFSFSKTPSYYDLLYPAWSFWGGGPAIATDPRGIGRWDLRRNTLKEAHQQWEWHHKKNVGFFRGSRTSGERDPLILLSRERPDLVDAQYTKNQAWRSMEDTLGVEPADVVSMETHCKYRYLFNFRGVAASFRLRHLFLCGSLVLHVGNEWVEFFYSSLRPWVHYVPLDTDLHNIRELLDFLKTHDDIAKEIAERGYRHIWDHLDMDDVLCYWRSLLLGYARLASWSVVRQEPFIALSHTGKS